MNSQNPALGLQKSSLEVSVAKAKNSNWSILCGNSAHSAYSLLCW